MFRYHGKASDLKRALSVVGRVVPKSNTIPILGNVVLEERGGHCCVMGTNLDVSVEVGTDVADVKGKTTIPHSRLSAFLNVLDDDVVSIEVGKDSGVATCKGGDAVSKIPTLPIEDMPEALFGDLEVPKDRTLQLGGDFVRHALKALSPACKSEKSRTYLMGARFDGIGKSIVATDGKIMAVEEIGFGGFKSGFTLPANAFDIVTSICDDGKCDIKVSENIITFKTGIGFVRTKMVDGEYPDYTRLLRNSERVLATISRHELDRVVAQGSLAHNSTSSACIVTINDDGMTVEKHGSDGDLSQSRAHAEVQNHARFGMDPAYLLWAANSFQDHVKDVDLMCDGENSPIFVRPTGSNVSLRLLMPMRV